MKVCNIKIIQSYIAEGGHTLILNLLNKKMNLKTQL